MRKPFIYTQLGSMLPRLIRHAPRRMKTETENVTSRGMEYDMDRFTRIA